MTEKMEVQALVSSLWHWISHHRWTNWELDCVAEGWSLSLTNQASCIPLSSNGTFHLHRLHPEVLRLPPASGVTCKPHGIMGIGVFPRTETNGQT